LEYDPRILNGNAEKPVQIVISQILTSVSQYFQQHYRSKLGTQEHKKLIQNVTTSKCEIA